ncbi:MAG: FtsJ-like methyltransferase family protein [Pseudomonadota bacterium]|nr:FtsJ-like methyltransferase family protein [Pseudomonadota bacterium]
MKRSDEYWAQRAKKEGYRSRASYKLLQLDEKYNLITKSSLIFDFGCAPGGWSQVIAEKINVSAKCIAIDILNMQRVDRVEFHQIDLFSNEFKDMMNKNSKCVDLIVSDISANLSGIKLVDDENNFELNLFCIEASKEMLNPNGALLIKTFNNSKLKEVVNKFNDVFSTVCVEKPVASKTSSSEVYLLGLIPK